MSGGKLKYSSIEELNAQVTVAKNLPVANLVKSAPKVMKGAEDAEIKDDPESVLQCFCTLYTSQFSRCSTTRGSSRGSFC